MLPVLLACESVWHTPHLDTNSTLPCTTFAVGCLTAQPPAASSTSAAGRNATRLRVDLSIRARTLSEHEAPMSRRGASGGAGSMAADEDAPEVPYADALDRPRGHHR